MNAAIAIAVTAATVFLCRPAVAADPGDKAGDKPKVSKNAFEGTKRAASPKRVARKSKPQTLIASVISTLPKGWRITSKGLPAQMAGIATGPSGETVVVSQLEEPPNAAETAGEDASTWLLARLGATNGRVAATGPFGSLTVRGTVRGPDRRVMALRAWVVPGKPTWLVSWVGPEKLAGAADKRAVEVAQRWAGS